MAGYNVDDALIDAIADNVLTHLECLPPEADREERQTLVASILFETLNSDRD